MNVSERNKRQNNRRLRTEKLPKQSVNIIVFRGLKVDCPYKQVAVLAVFCSVTFALIMYYENSFTLGGFSGNHMSPRVWKSGSSKPRNIMATLFNS